VHACTREPPTSVLYPVLHNAMLYGGALGCSSMDRGRFSELSRIESGCRARGLRPVTRQPARLQSAEGSLRVRCVRLQGWLLALCGSGLTRSR
jgi:hypothetical protein